MKILAESISKKFVQQSIFKNVSLSFESPNSYALLGANGSGKSTLLRILAGIQSPSKGRLEYSKKGIVLTAESVYQELSFCAPAMDLIEEMSLRELLHFHFSFKPIYKGISIQKIIELTGLEKAADKHISQYSSGMKQRVKLAQAIFTDTALLLLDEPCTNLDQAGVDQYRTWIKDYSNDRLLIVASNESREYDFCEHLISMEDLKQNNTNNS